MLLLWCAMGAALAIATWLFASQPLSLLLDRVTTRRVAAIAQTPNHYGGGGFTAGDVDLTFAGLDNLRTDVTLGSDEHSRLVLRSGGQAFTLGPRSAPDPGGRPEIDFTPDPGDTVTLTHEESWLPWPTFLEWKLMTRTPAFKKHAYYHLQWRKKSGETLDMLWRYEQGKYEAGWTKPAMLFNFETGLIRVAIRPSPAWPAVTAYVTKTKGWTPDTYKLRYRSSSADGRTQVIEVIHRADDQAVAPAAGLSFAVQVDSLSSKVIAEIGWQ